MNLPGYMVYLPALAKSSFSYIYNFGKVTIIIAPGDKDL
jgi:hypothetical protein